MREVSVFTFLYNSFKCYTCHEVNAPETADRTFSRLETASVHYVVGKK